MGNRIRAVVVVRDGTPTGDALVTEIRDTVRESLAPYKVPHVVDFSEALPKSAVGKVVRRALIEEPDGDAADAAQHPRISTGRIEK